MPGDWPQTVQPFTPTNLPAGASFSVPSNDLVLWDGQIDSDEPTGVALDISGQLTESRAPAVVNTPTPQVVPGTLLVGGDSIASTGSDEWPLYAGLQPSVFANRTAVLDGSVAGTMIAPGTAAGWIDWVRCLSGGRIRTVKNGGFTGSTTRAQLQAMTNPTTPFNGAFFITGVTPAPGIVIWQGAGGDDGNVLSTEETIRNLTGVAGVNSPYDGIYQTLIKTFPTSLICVCTQTPLSPDDDGTRRPVNQAIRDFALRYQVKLIDFEKILMDPLTGQVKATYSGDGTHQNATGAYWMAKEVLAAIGDAMPQENGMVNDYLVDPTVQAAAGGWGTDALMSGTLGAGHTATNWNTTVAGGVASLIAREDLYGNWQRVQLPAGLSVATSLFVFKLTPAAATVAGAIWYAECEVRVPFADWVGVTEFSLQCTTGTAGTTSTVLQTAGLSPALYPYQTPPPGERMVLRTNPIVMPVGIAGGGFILIVLTGIAGTIDVGRFSLVRVNP